MNILSIDTLSKTLSVAASGTKGVVTQSFTGKGCSHAEQLVPLIDTAVSAAGFSADTVDVVLAAEGPGSFTGLRLGYAAAKALQLVSNALFIPVPTLPCLAFQYAAWKEGLAVILDAKRGRFYTQFFKNGKNTSGVFDKAPDDLLSLFTEDLDWLITGYGVASFNAHPCIAKQSSRFLCIEARPESFAPSMIAYAEYYFSQTLTEIRQNVHTSDYAFPVYIRKSDAEKVV